MTKEETFWEALKDLPEHKREFDADVFNCIMDAMENYATDRVVEEGLKCIEAYEGSLPIKQK